MPKISELPEVVELLASDELVVARAGATMKVKPPVFGSNSTFNVKTYGAKGDGATDDTQKIQDAINAAEVAGGGRVLFPRGTYLLTTVTTAGGSSWHLAVKSSKIQLVSEGATLKTSVLDAHIFAISGGGLPAGMAQSSSYEYLDATTYTINPAAAGAMSITTATAANAGNFTAGDFIYIRTGETGASANSTPDSEINEVLSASGVTGVITLRRPLAKAYAQEYFITGTSGKTSTSVTANPAILGVAKVTDRTITDIWMEGFRFELSGTAAGVCAGGQIVRLTIRNNVLHSSAANPNGWPAGLMNMGAYRDGLIEDNRIHLEATGSSSYVLTTAVGCSDVMIRGNTLSGNKVVQIHLHEGGARIQVRDNIILSKPSSADEQAISIRARAYNLVIEGNTIVNSGNTAAVFVDGDCVGGGAIRGNTVRGANHADAIAVYAPGWEVTGNDVTAAILHMPQASTPILASGMPVRQECLMGWVADNIQTVTLGTIPSRSYVAGVRIFVLEGFNSSGTDFIAVGTDADNGLWAGSTDVSTSGDKAVAAGSFWGTGRGHAEADYVTKAYYANGGTEPTTGRALVIVEFYRSPNAVS